MNHFSLREKIQFCSGTVQTQVCTVIRRYWDRSLLANIICYDIMYPERTPCKTLSLNILFLALFYKQFVPFRKFWKASGEGGGGGRRGKEENENHLYRQTGKIECFF